MTKYTFAEKKTEKARHYGMGVVSLSKKNLCDPPLAKPEIVQTISIANPN